MTVGLECEAGRVRSLASPSATEPAVLVVDRRMCVKLRNAAAQALVSRGVIALDRESRIVGSFAARLRRPSDDLAPTSSLARDRRDCSLGVCVTPLGPSDDADEDELFVLIVRDARAELHARARAAARRHGLTGQEERMLLLIVEGLDPLAAARRLGVARSTARTHLQRIFEKVGVSRQSELVAFVARSSNVSDALCA